MPVLIEDMWEWGEVWIVWNDKCYCNVRVLFVGGLSASSCD